MGEVTLTVQVRSAADGTVLRQLQDRVRDSREGLQLWPGIVRQSVDREFASHSWSSPSGVSVPWAQRVPFGNRVLGAEPLVNTGAYRAALLGGDGSITEVGADSVRVGVSGVRFPGAATLRGGSGNVVSQAPVYVKPVKRSSGKRSGGSWVRQWAMFWFLGLRYNVWLSEAKLREGLKMVPRPHMTMNPRLRLELLTSWKQWLTRGLR